MTLDDIKLSSPYNDEPLRDPCKCDVCGEYFERDAMYLLGENNDNYDEDSIVCEFDFNQLKIVKYYGTRNNFRI